MGQIGVGALADIVLWHPSNFGVKPSLVLKAGMIAYAAMGDANASIPTVQPVYARPMWAAEPLAAAATSVLFVSKVSIDEEHVQKYGLKKRIEAVKGCRSVKKSDMKWNERTPVMKVDPESFEVWADEERVTVEEAQRLPLGKAYNLF